METQQSGQHRCNARYLLLLVHDRIVRCIWFKVHCHTLAHEREQCQNIILFTILFELLTQTLHEPWSLCCVSPRIETCLAIIEQKVQINHILIIYKQVIKFLCHFAIRNVHVVRKYTTNLKTKIWTMINCTQTNWLIFHIDKFIYRLIYA